MNELAKAIHQLISSQKVSSAFLSPLEEKSQSEVISFLQGLQSFFENTPVNPGDEPEPVEWNIPLPRLLDHNLKK